MANNEIKQKIVLEGEKQYRDAIKDAQRNLKTLRSELKAETAELGSNATAQQKNEAKVKSLKKQIEEQEKIVKANREALEEVKQKYGDNADAIAKYEQKLNDSRTALANMKNELGSVGQTMQTVQSNADMATVATKSVADAMKSVSDVAGSISGALEDAFTSVLDTLHEAVAALWDEIMETAAKANAWTDLADYFGSTAGQVQQWSNAIQGAGGSFDNFTTILNRFKTGGVNKKITELFGVSDENYQNDLEYTAAVLDAMAKAREEMTKNGTWDSALAEIFGGRKSQAAGWFVSNWDQIQKNLERYDAENGGVGMTDEQLSTMNELYITVSNIQTTWQAFKESFLAGAFGKLSLDLAGNAQGILDGLIAFMNADNQGERDEAIKQIQTNMEDFFRKLGEAIEAAAKALDEVGTELAGSDNGYVATIGRVLQGLSDVLEWLTKPESLEQVKAFFETLIGIWATGKVTSAVSNILSFVGNLKVLGLFGAGTNTAAIATAGTQAGASWGSAFAGAVMKAAPWLIGLYTLLNPGSTSDTIGDNTLVDAEGNLTTEAQEYGYRQDENGEIYQDRDSEIAAAVQTAWDLYRTGKLGQEGIQELSEKVMNDEAMQSLMDALWKFRQDNPDWQGIEDLPSTFFSDMWKYTTQGGNSGNTDGLTSTDAKDMSGAVRQLPGEIKKSMLGMKVMMDRTVVGQMVADEVSRQIAGYIV